MIAHAERNGSDTKTRIEILTEEVSPSRLKRWSTCHLQFYFHYVAQIPKPATVALTVGKIVHSVLQEWNRRRWRGDFTFRDKLGEVLDAKWTDEQVGQEIDWDGDEPKEKSKSLALIEFYLDQTPIKPDEKPSAVEVHLEANLGKHGLPNLIGIIDLVLKGGVIVDFKTSGQSPQVDALVHQNEIQLTSYGILFRDNTGNKESEFQLHHLIKTKVPKLIVTSLPPITDQQITRLFKQIESYVEGVEREDFVPMPGMACLSCQFINECRSWH